jgi:hypothetical protein
MLVVSRWWFGRWSPVVRFFAVSKIISHYERTAND